MAYTNKAEFVVANSPFRGFLAFDKSVKIKRIELLFKNDLRDDSLFAARLTAEGCVIGYLETVSPWHDLCTKIFYDLIRWESPVPGGIDVLHENKDGQLDKIVVHYEER